MKKLFLALFLFAFISCEKNSDKVCYYCTFGASVGGVVPSPKTVCVEPWEPAPTNFQDNNGNDLNSHCVKQ